MQKTKKSTGDFIIFGKTKQKDKSTREKEGKKRRKQKSIGEQTRPIEIKGEGQRKLMVSSNNPNSDHQKWSHL